jgi:molybdate transport system substrate-binding protein
MISSKGWLEPFMKQKHTAIALCLWCLITPVSSFAKPLRIAVAANFKPILEDITKSYSHTVKISSGSTGALFAQIVQGAPFDIFMAADAERPALLEQRQLTQLRRTYAVGRLVLWAPDNAPVSQQTLRIAPQPLAIANPRHAPYGIAAMEVVRHSDQLGLRLVLGSNVAQAVTFIKTGNAAAGLVGLSQMIYLKVPSNEYWIVAKEMYAPIKQQLVILNNAPPEARSFIDHLQSAQIQALISTAGYDLPEVEGVH